MALAFYRKYRPRCFDDLVGQTAVAELFRNAARADRLVHAYLLAGPRGTGKTTTARLIAKIANCTDSDHLRRHGEACGHCSACQTIDNNQTLDVIEIDAASNRGIDEIRQLRESITFSPASLRKKIYIIDEAHMLTREASNALLKTLEEPPAHAILILATTEAEKIPATIASRTQRFHFKKLALQEMAAKLRRISQSEGLETTDEALELIAAAADGSLRDAESLLDQIGALASPVDAAAVEKTIGHIGFKKVAAVAGLLVSRDLPAVLASLNELNRGGYNLTAFAKELITYLRRTLSLRFDPGLEPLFAEELTAEQLTHLKKHSQATTVDHHLELLKSLIRAYSEMRYSPFPHVPLEVAIIENLRQDK